MELCWCHNSACETGFDHKGSLFACVNFQDLLPQKPINAGFMFSSQLMICAESWPDNCTIEMAFTKNKIVEVIHVPGFRLESGKQHTSPHGVAALVFNP